MATLSSCQGPSTAALASGSVARHSGLAAALPACRAARPYCPDAEARDRPGSTSGAGAEVPRLEPAGAQYGPHRAGRGRATHTHTHTRKKNTQICLCAYVRQKKRVS